MNNLIKGITGIVAFAATSKVGSDMYDSYRERKKERAYKEVSEFIQSMDIDKLQKAASGNNTALVGEVIEDIINASEKIRTKSKLEDLKEDAVKSFDVVKSMLNNAADNLVDVANEVINELSETHKQPTFTEFINGVKPLTVTSDNGVIFYTVNDTNILFVDFKNKSVKIRVDNKIHFYDFEGAKFV